MTVSRHTTRAPEKLGVVAPPSEAVGSLTPKRSEPGHRVQIPIERPLGAGRPAKEFLYWGGRRSDRELTRFHDSGTF